MSIVEKLQDYMKRKNLKLKQVSEMTGIPYDRMYKWISGVNKPKAEDAEIIDDLISGRTSNMIQEHQAPYRPGSSLQQPNNCMETLAKAMEVILSQQKTIESLINNNTQFRQTAASG